LPVILWVILWIISAVILILSAPVFQAGTSLPAAAPDPAFFPGLLDF
jgi:hypothetical protein